MLILLGLCLVDNGLNFESVERCNFSGLLTFNFAPVVNNNFSNSESPSV